MSKYGWRDGKLVLKDLIVDNAPEFTELIGNDIVVVINGVKRKITTES
jgi:hypothetical protein